MAKPTASGPIKSTTTTTAPSSPPPYFKMITEAITALKDRTGSSQPAIARFIEEKYKKSSLPSNFKKVLSVQLKRFVKSERLVKCKNSYKISSTEKLQLGIKETRKKKGASKTAPEKKAAEKKISSKGVQTRRLSQVKTPEVFKKEVKAAKMKRLSQVKTPDGFKKEKKSTPMQKKNLKAGSSSSSRAHNK
ncbi:HISTONE H1 [Salix koriyanagi]|uniref:HISTONE H1 n=1 Tax=Salix koriyanagi TaxID=2511006 RepID=A0A9Q0TFA1_9ROSI|nr:HISTONE H1 [Salix koriyanagi]